MRSSARRLLLALVLGSSCMLSTAWARQRRPVAASDPGLLRARELLLAPPSGAAAPFEVGLPDGRRPLVRLERFAATRPGGATARGSLASDPGGYAAFAIQDDALVGVLREGGRLYRVERDAEGALAFVQSERSFPPCETSPLPLSTAPDPGGPQRSEAGGTQPSRATTPGPLRPTFAPQVPSSVGDTVVDALVCWTQEAAIAAGGQATILALIDLAALETNMAFENSRVSLFLRVVHAQGLVYVESGSMAADLQRLRVNGDGFLDEVHGLRDQYGADVVSLFVANTSACGRSYNMGNPPSVEFAPFAFNLVSQGCATGYYAFGHELGHNFGLNHDRPQATGVPSYPWAYGYWSQDQVHRTIMALERAGNFGVRVPYYSNPDVTYAGLPLGIAAPGREAADCARALDDNAGILASWRPTTTP